MNYEECTDDLGTYKRMESLMQINEVSKTFKNNDGSANTVLKNVTFDIKDIYGKPQIISLLGQSGSGKTTLLRIIAGLDSPDEGNVLISNGGRDAEHSMHQVQAGQVGVVFQKYPLFDNLTVLENLVIPAVKTGTKEDLAIEKASIYINAFNMESSTGSYPVQLSGGMRQRIAILQQLMVEGRHFIVLDEPFSGLDVKNLQSVISMLNNVASMHTLNTFIVVTHDVTNALIVSDTVHVLGRTLEGTTLSKSASIVKTYDLVNEGLAYRPKIEDVPRFAEIRKELKYDIIPNI